MRHSASSPSSPVSSASSSLTLPSQVLNTFLSLLFRKNKEKKRKENLQCPFHLLPLPTGKVLEGVTSFCLFIVPRSCYLNSPLCCHMVLWKSPVGSKSKIFSSSSSSHSCVHYKCPLPPLVATLLHASGFLLTSLATPSGDVCLLLFLDQT